MPANSGLPPNSRPRYLLNAGMDVTEGREDLFNEIYDKEHTPALLSVPGVVSVRRYVRRPISISIGGSIHKPAFGSDPVYSALFEIESPDVLVSAAWAEAVDWGRWPSEIRPYTRNRQHTLHEVIEISR